MTPEADLAEFVKTAGAGSAPLVAAWAVYRIGRLESQVKSIAAHLGAIDCPRHRRNPLPTLAAVVAVGFVLCFASGCFTPQQQAWTCDRAEEAMTAYQAAEAAGLVSDPRVIASVRVAAAFLHQFCGWTVPRGFSEAYDHNGVLILSPP